MLTQVPLQSKSKVITSKVEADGGRYFAELVAGLNFVQAAVGLDHVVDLEVDLVLGRGHLLDGDGGAVVLSQLCFAAVPVHFGLRMTHQLALEDESVTLVLLAQLRLLGEARRQVFGETHCDAE